MCRCLCDGLLPRRPTELGKLVSVFVLVSYYLQFACASPLRIKREVLDESVQNYLMSFGYIPKSADGAFALRTEESVRSALTDLQQFAGIPATGRLDEATMELMRRPRCGLPDKIVNQTSGRRRKRFALQGQKWPYTNLTWSLRTKNLRDLHTYEIRFLISKAFEVWSRHSKLTFTEVDSARADILIFFYSGEHGDNFPFDGKGVILAHAFFPNGGRSTDVHFDADESWSTKSDPDNGTNFFNVAAHEFGHSLGLSHSSVESALMYPWYKDIEQNGFDYELPEDDKTAIQTLYGAREERLWGRINPYRPPTPPTTTTTTTTTTTRRPYYTRPPHPRPYDPRYPNGQNPYTPHQYYPHHETPNYPRKPMHPGKKPHYPKYDPDSRYPYGGKYPDKYHPTRKYHYHTTHKPTLATPVNNPDKYPRRPEPPRRGHYPPKESPTRQRPPNTCDTSYDAIAVIRREVFIFKDAYFWRIGDRGLLPDYPAEIIRLWRGLPHNLTHVDAVYERPDHKIVFFIGKLFYVFTGNILESGYPRPLTDLGLPATLKKLDAAMVWGHNGHTYFYSGNRYWKFDEETKIVELDYPRHISMWKGVGSDIDAVFQWKDGKTYFFKGKGFWKFNDQLMRVEHEKQKLSAPFWMGCTYNLEGPEYQDKLPYRHDPNAASYNKLSVSVFSLSLLIVLLKLLQI